MSRWILMFVLFNITYIDNVSMGTQHINQHVNTRLLRHIISPENTMTKNDVENLTVEQPPPILNIKNNSTSQSMNSLVKTSETNATKINKINSNTLIIPRIMPPSLDYDTLLRGFYVFLGLSIFVLLYVLFRSYRLRKGGHLPNIVRKYGVLTNRTDIEMLPLPLDEDDDDDTVFELGRHVTR